MDMKFKQALKEGLGKSEYEPGNFVKLKPSGLKKVKKQNPKENIKLYKSWQLHIFKYKDYDDSYKVVVAPPFTQDLEKRVIPFTANIDIEDIERKSDIRGR